MGLLVDGKRQDRWYDTASTSGRFVRHQSDRHRVPWACVDFTKPHNRSRFSQAA
jgi:putative glutathione S-transferase